MSTVVDWAVRVLETLGAPGVGLMTAVETILPPVPSEIVLPLAGYTASHGHYGLISAIVWATVGSLVGALTLYGLGARWGRAASAPPWIESHFFTPVMSSGRSSGSVGTAGQRCSSVGSFRASAALSRSRPG